MNNANINLKTPLINRKPLILVLNLYVKSFFKKKKNITKNIIIIKL